MSKLTTLLEFVQQPADLVVNEDEGYIDNVRILGLNSQNGRRYLREGVGDAIALYEGRQTNVDHPARAGEQTKVSSRIGWLENVRQDSDGGLRGRWNILKSHQLAPMIFESARRNSRLMGLSHNASGKTRRDKDGTEIVESIEHVHSVDLVADPATVKGLSESRSPMKRTVKQLIEALKTTRPGYARGLREEVEAGVMDDSMTMDEPEPMDEPAIEEPAATADHEQALKDGFRGAVVAILDDDGMDMKGKLAKIKEILQAQEKIMGAGNGGSDSGSSDGPPGESTAEESLKRKVRAHELLMEARLSDKVLMRALYGCASEAEMREVIGEYNQGHRNNSGPRSASPQQFKESKDDDDLPKSPKELRESRYAARN